jgi:hypothetical protein
MTRSTVASGGGIVAIDGNVRLSIDRDSAEPSAQRAFACGSETFNSGAIVSPCGAADQEIEIGPEPDRNSPGADLGARAGIDKGAATGRQHVQRPFQQAMNDAPLAIPERDLAING